MIDNYILDENGNPVPCKNIVEWGKWFSRANRIVQQVRLPSGIFVSTVFLGLDHNYGEGKPLLWETMIFGGRRDQYQERYSSKKEALDGHKRALELVSSEIAPNSEVMVTGRKFRN